MFFMKVKFFNWVYLGNVINENMVFHFTPLAQSRSYPSSIDGNKKYFRKEKPISS